MATPLTSEDVLAYMVQPHAVTIQNKALDYFIKAKLEELTTYLASLSQMDKEYALDQIVYYVMTSKINLTKQKDFIQSLSQTQPSILLKSQGNGFTVTLPVFNYAAKARWILNQWQLNQYEQALIALLKQKNSNFFNWLVADEASYPLRKEAVLNQIPLLNESQISVLIKNYLQDENHLWLPDNGVLAALINQSQDGDLYSILWKRKIDHYTLEVIERLSSGPISDAHIEQLIKAADNPKLKLNVIRHLGVLSPMPPKVEAFLVSELNKFNRGDNIAALLASLGKTSWLTQQLTHVSLLGRRNIKSALSSAN